MSYECKILADSISPSGVRLTTMQVTFPRFILAEFNTHRMLSRNAASSRAIPVAKRIQELRDKGPFIPEAFTRNKRGMQGGEGLDGLDGTMAAAAWVQAAAWAITHAEDLARVGVHKQYANRLLEPFAWVTVVVTATEWDNFFHLRCHPDAQPEFQRIANMMYAARSHSEPARVGNGEWHLPYILPEDRLVQSYTELPAVSAARCARVSYLTHEGTRDIKADIALGERLASAGHLSPFEHPAKAMYADPVHKQRDKTHWYGGNFFGWKQYRKMIPNEEDMLGER